MAPWRGGHNANAVSKSNGAPPGLSTIWGVERGAGQAVFRRASFWLSRCGCLSLGASRRPAPGRGSLADRERRGEERSGRSE